MLVPSISFFCAAIICLFAVGGWLVQYNLEHDIKPYGFRAFDLRQSSFWQYILLVLKGACMLTLALAVLYLLLKTLGVKPMFAIVTCASLLCSWLFGKYAIGISFPKLGERMVNLLAALSAATLTASWLFFPNWLTIDASAAILAVWLLVGLAATNLSTILAISAIVILYDVVNMFGTKMMQEVAGSAVRELPIMLIAPARLSLDSPPLFALGLGDVILPGLIVIYAFAEDWRLKSSALANGALLGYTAGFYITIAVVFITHFPQPATLYLMPATLAGLWIARKFFT